MVPGPKSFIWAGFRQKCQKHDFPSQKAKTLKLSAQWAVVDEREMHVPREIKPYQGKLSRTGGNLSRTGGKLSRTKGNLSRTAGKLSRTTGKLSCTNGKLSRTAGN